MIRTRSLAIALFLCGGAAKAQDGPTTPSGAGTSGSPNDECCPPRQSIAPFEPRGGLMMTAEVTVSPDGDMSIVVDDPMTATISGLAGVARLYVAHTARYTNTPEALASVLGELDSERPPGLPLGNVRSTREPPDRVPASLAAALGRAATNRPPRTTYTSFRRDV
jgi:hypothetical protein